MTRAIRGPSLARRSGTGKTPVPTRLNPVSRSRALGGRIPLPQGDPVASLAVFDLIHERADEHQAPPADPLEVGRVRGVGHRGGVEAGPFVLHDVDGLRAGQRGPDVDPPVPVGRLPSPLLAEVPKDPLVLLAEVGAELQVAVLDGVEQGLVQGHPDPEPFGPVAGVQERGDLLQVAEQGRDPGGVVVEDEAELAIGQAVEPRSGWGRARATARTLPTVRTTSRARLRLRT